MGSAMISYISKLCFKENLLVIHEVLVMLLKTKRKLESTIMNRIRQNTDQNPTSYGLVNAMSYLGNSPWREPPGGDFRGKKGRPPDIWNSIFISNLVSSKT